VFSREIDRAVKGEEQKVRRKTTPLTLQVCWILGESVTKLKRATVSEGAARE